MRWWELVGVDVRFSGGVEFGGLLRLLLFERGIPEPPSGEDQGHRLDGEVAALDELLIVLFSEPGADKADHGDVVGEDPDDVGALRFLVDALERVSRAKLGPVPRAPTWPEATPAPSHRTAPSAALAHRRRGRRPNPGYRSPIRPAPGAAGILCST
jgi:hypothetical protein